MPVARALRLAIALVTMLVVLPAPRPALSWDLSPAPVLVRMYVSGGGADGARTVARRVAADILRRARVPIEWLDCTVSGTEPEPPLFCQQPPRPDELIVRLLAASAADASEALGYSMIDVELRRGWLATIFIDRVDRLAAAARTDRGRLLGRAIAHELAHLLLGTSRHSARGLMRAYWRAPDFAHEKPWDWWLASDDARLVESAYLARVSGAEPTLAEFRRDEPTRDSEAPPQSPPCPCARVPGSG